MKRIWNKAFLVILVTCASYWSLNAQLEIGCAKGYSRVGDVAGACVEVKVYRIFGVVVTFEECETDPGVVQGNSNCSLPPEKVVG